MSAPDAADARMRSQAEEALARNADINCPGFESSRVFALTSAILDDPTAGDKTRRRLIRNIKSIILFVIHPTSPIDPSNPRTRPGKGTSGGALRPAYWYADLKSRGVVRRGQPSTLLLGRKKKADVVIELLDRDLVDMATGKVHPQKLFNNGRIKIKGSLDVALRFADFISHERSKLYGVQPPSENATPAKIDRTDDHDGEYGDGAPAPVSDFRPAGMRSKL